MVEAILASFLCAKLQFLVHEEKQLPALLKCTFPSAPGVSPRTFAKSFAESVPLLIIGHAHSVNRLHFSCSSHSMPHAQATLNLAFLDRRQSEIVPKLSKGLSELEPTIREELGELAVRGAAWGWLVTGTGLK